MVPGAECLVDLKGSMLAPREGISGERPGRIGNLLMAFGLVAALGLGLVFRLGLHPERWWFNPDEGYYYQVATTASVETAERVIRQNAHPPLHYKVLRWAAPFVDDVTELRYLSLIASLLGILAAGWLGGLCGAEMGGRWGRVVGVWFGAFSIALAPGILAQAVTLRPYSIGLFAVILAWGSFIRYVQTGRATWLPSLALGFLLAVLQMYSAFLLVLAVAVVFLGLLLTGKLKRQQVAGLSLAAAPALVAMGWLYATHLRPYLLRGGIRHWATTSWLPEAYPKSLVEAIPLSFGAAEHAFGDSLVWAVLIPAGVAVGLALVQRRGLPAVLLLVVAGIAVVAGRAGLMPLGPTRHSLYLAPVLMSAAAGGLGWLVGRFQAPATGTESPVQRRARWLVLAALALGFVVPVAVDALRMLREGPQAVLGPARTELVVPRESMATVSGFVRDTSVTAWLTDWQTAQMLMPLARPEDRVLFPDPVFDGFRLNALGRRFLVVKNWHLAEAFSSREDRIDRAIEALAADPGSGDRRVGLIAGGEGISEAYRVVVALRASGVREIVAAGDMHLAALLTEAENLRSWRRHRAEAFLRP
jgi:hypothetical protein